MIVLDTSILSLALRRRPETGAEPREVAALRRVMSANVQTAVPGIVLQEVLTGIKTVPQFLQLKRALDDFRLLLAAREHHLAAAEIANACRSHGIAPGLADCLIAAMTIAEHGHLFTMDRDFDLIAEHCALRLVDRSALSG